MKADFDIGNLVYVILTIVFLAVGAFGKKKKPVVRVSDEPQDEKEDPESIKSQFKDLIREFNPAPEIYGAREYIFPKIESVEEGQALDYATELSTASKIDIIPDGEKSIDSNIDYRDQAQSSLDTAGMDEGEPAFDYTKDHSSLVYNKITKEYSSVLTDDEEVLAEIVDGFDARTAFVYSEIFKRKEF